MFKILITGNRFMLPEMLAQEIQAKLGDKYPFEIETYKFENVPAKEYYLYDETVVPSGMAVENPNIQKPKIDGIREYYGDPYALKGMIHDIDLLIMYGNALPKAVIDEANRLKCVLVMRGGPVNVDQEYLRGKGIGFYHTEGRNASGVAELTIGLLISFMRHITFSNESLRKNVWTLKFNTFETAGSELEGKSVGLIGFGKIARHLCRLLVAFGCNVMAHDPFCNAEEIEVLGACPAGMDEILQNCDIVSLHARRRKGEPPLIGERELSMMKPTAILANTARGMLLDYVALKRFLKENRIQGAVLDVFGDEPFEFYKELVALPNVLATSHIGGVTREAAVRGSRLTVALVDELLAKYIVS